jgi:hypothetical protein
MISSCDSYCLRFQTNIAIDIYYMIFSSSRNSQDYIYLIKVLITHTALELNSSPVNIIYIQLSDCYVRDEAYEQIMEIVIVYTKMIHTFISCQIR